MQGKNRSILTHHLLYRHHNNPGCDPYQVFCSMDAMLVHLFSYLSLYLPKTAEQAVLEFATAKSKL